MRISEDEDKQAKRAQEHRMNIRLGARIRTLRKQRGIRQQDMAAYFGVTFQQVQKWEKGMNRISAARLKMLCGLFDVSLDQFFFD